MHQTLRAAQRPLTVAVLFFTLVMAFTVPSFASGAPCIAGDPAVVPNGWDPAATPMTDAGNSTFTFSTVVASPGFYQFKVLMQCGDWSSAATGDGFHNSWLDTSTANQSVTITLDANTYNDGFVPATNIVMVSGDTLPSSWNAVGAFQGWNNNDSNMTLQDIGGGLLERTITVASAGTYEAKITQSGSWARQFIALGGRATDGPVTQFTTTAPNETVTVTLNTITGRFRYQPNGDGDSGSGASHDNDIWYSHLGHDSRDGLYRSPVGSQPAGTPITLRLRAANGDLTGATVRVWNDRFDQQIFLPMTRVAAQGDYEWWEATLNTGTVPNVFYYRFIANDGTATAFYEDTDLRGGWGEAIPTSQDRSWQITLYDPAFRTPEWVHNAIIYQIFPDRFRDGDPTNNQPPGMFFYNEPGGTIFRSNDPDENWNTLICDPRQTYSTPAGDPTCEGSWSRNFYGGDLQGIKDKVGYLQSLGVTAVYLNPIFSSPSNHKYDTRDFSQIDPFFGDLDLFIEMVDALNNAGIRIILDGVFNHTSSDSYYFDRYGNYDDAIYGPGACESITSPRVDWYTFFPYSGTGTAPCSDNRDYPKWFGIFDSLPVLRTQEKPAQDLIWGDGFDHTWSGVSEPIGPYWAQWIDGWRLDVSPEVDHGMQDELNDPRQQFNPYWEEFRKAVHAVNPDLYIVGEEWGLATSWTSGGVSGGVDFGPNGNPGEWDATMNYQQSAAILSFWRDTYFEDNDFNPGSSAGPLTPLTPSQVNARLLNLQERYSPQAFAAMMNLFGSHDTNRVLFLLDHGHPVNPPNLTVHPVSPSYDWSDAITRLKGAALMQMTLPGAPTIYYGDEVGLVGQSTFAGGKWEDDPYNRVPYPWLDESGTPFFTHLQSDAPGSPRAELFAYYQTLTSARNNHAVLRTGSFDPLLTDDTNNVYVYGRRLGNEYAIVIINRAGSAQNVTVNVDGYAPYNATFDDLLTTAIESYTVTTSGTLTVPSVPARNGALLILTSPPAAAVLPVDDLQVSSATATQVGLTWSPALGATEYLVYRSLLSGGGYELIGDTLTTTYTDNTVVAGTTYYYVVVSRNATSGLVSDNSNEVSATPAWDLSSAYLNVQWPPEITGHVISTSVRTPDIFGQIYIAGGTDQPAQAPGIRAQVGWGTGNPSVDATGWQWAEMTFNGKAGNNDEYKGSLLPDQIGNFKYTVRYSADNGATWYYASEFNGGGSPLRDLEVVASNDDTAPTAPVLSVTGVSSGSISLAWTESTDDEGIAFYRVFRSLTDDNNFSQIATTTGLAYTDTSVTTDTTYDYYVVAVDTSFNPSAPSNIVTATAENVMIEVTFVANVPAWTPGTVYIVGNNPVWGPWNPGLVAMTQTAPNVWEWTGTFLSGTALEYKFTRGDWDRVEKEADGYAEVPNRPLIVTDEGDRKQTVNNTVVNWRDLIVIDYSPANGAVVPPLTTVSVTWNKDFGVSQFVVTDPQGDPVSGAYSHDSASRTTTFTPDTGFSTGVHTVTVSGFSASGDQQFVPTTFSFEVAGVGAFNLISPVNDAFFRDPADVTAITWQHTPLAVSYDLNLYRISNNTRIGVVVESNLLAADVCDGATGLCTMPVDASLQALLSNGTYAWTVVAHDGSNTREATNAPFLFVVDTGTIQLIENGGFELYQGRFPFGWTHRLQSGSRVLCDNPNRTVAFEGVCAFRFRGNTPTNSRLQQRPDVSRLSDNETLVFSVRANSRNAVINRSFALVRVTYTDNTRETIHLFLPSATTGDYVLLSETLTTTKPVKNILVTLRFVSNRGNLFLDAVSLTATPVAPVNPPSDPDSIPVIPEFSGDPMTPELDGDIIPLPELPDGEQFRR